MIRMVARVCAKTMVTRRPLRHGDEEVSRFMATLLQKVNNFRKKPARSDVG